MIVPKPRASTPQAVGIAFSSRGHRVPKPRALSRVFELTMSPLTTMTLE